MKAKNAIIDLFLSMSTHKEVLPEGPEDSGRYQSLEARGLVGKNNGSKDGYYRMTEAGYLIRQSIVNGGIRIEQDSPGYKKLRVVIS